MTAENSCSYMRFRILGFDIWDLIFGIWSLGFWISNDDLALVDSLHSDSDFGAGSFLAALAFLWS
jgi:hypothetical protein